MEEKKEIRKTLIVKRDSLNPDVWSQYSNSIQRNIIKSDIYKKADCILCYADFHGEVGTLTLIEDALINNKKVYLPKVIENFDESRMEFYRIFSTFELIGGYKGIMEPTGNVSRVFNYDEHANENILILVPGVAFDKDFNRLGYGKGYYDNYLKDKLSMLKCGLCFSMQILDNVPASEQDIKLDYLITENTSVSDINKLHY